MDITNKMEKLKVEEIVLVVRTKDRVLEISNIKARNVDTQLSIHLKLQTLTSHSSAKVWVRLGTQNTL